ncbi:MAG: hypothetical protein CMK06_07915 [Ponticaulis sp.]|nr:hypothetical protein [Ponticaulis sp.]
MLKPLTCLVLGLATTGLAHAQKIRAADTGAVDLELLGVEAPYDGPLTISKGDVLWTETMQPHHVKVLVDPVGKRIRPPVDGVEAGTTLIGVTLESGIAYCPPIEFDAPVARVQCFQDLNDDSVFDGGYYSDQRGFDTQFLSGWLRGLSGLTPKIAYRDADQDTPVPTGKFMVQFDGMRRGVPQFRNWVEEERTDTRGSCDIPEAGVCDYRGRRFRFTENADASVTFEPIAEAPRRLVIFSSQSSFRR